MGVRPLRLFLTFTVRGWTFRRQNLTSVDVRFWRLKSTCTVRVNTTHQQCKMVLDKRDSTVEYTYVHGICFWTYCLRNKHCPLTSFINKRRNVYLWHDITYLPICFLIFQSLLPMFSWYNIVHIVSVTGSLTYIGLKKYPIESRLGTKENLIQFKYMTLYKISPFLYTLSCELHQQIITTWRHVQLTPGAQRYSI